MEFFGPEIETVFVMYGHVLHRLREHLNVPGSSSVDYIGETGRRLGDRFREHLLDVKNKNPHQHTVDTPVCLPPRRRSQPSSLKSWHYTISGMSDICD